MFNLKACRLCGTPDYFQNRYINNGEHIKDIMYYKDQYCLFYSFFSLH